MSPGMGKKNQRPVGHWFLLAEDAEEVDANLYSPRKLAPSGSGRTHLIYVFFNRTRQLLLTLVADVEIFSRNSLRHSPACPHQCATVGNVPNVKTGVKNLTAL